MDGPRALQPADALQRALESQHYVIESEQAFALSIALHLEKPVLVEGPPGVGKTELAKALSGALGLPLIRLQCYEGLGEEKALYEWNYSKQLLHIQTDGRRGWDALAGDIFSEAYLLERPLLQSIRSPERSLLLVDELDRVDEEFEAFLLELLSDFQITIPELGTLQAVFKPVVVLTSNGTRELSEALRRRCVFLYLDFPDPQREREIVMRKVPDLDRALGARVVEIVQRLRRAELKKPPSVSETLDWSRALRATQAQALTRAQFERTLPLLLKHQDDIVRVRELDDLFPDGG